MARRSVFWLTLAFTWGLAACATSMEPASTKPKDTKSRLAPVTVDDGRSLEEAAPDPGFADQLSLRGNLGKTPDQPIHIEPRAVDEIERMAHPQETWSSEETPIYASDEVSRIPGTKGTSVHLVTHTPIAVASARTEPGKCTIDLDCDAPERCLRPAGAVGPWGICGRAIHELSGESTGSRRVRSCKADLPCPPSHTCVPVSGPFGICMSRD